MKKSISILMVTFALAIAMPSQAQIRLGVKGGLNLANSLSDTWADAANVDNYTGFFIGPMVDITIPIVGLGVDGALMYSQKGNKLDGETLKQQGLEIPINLKYSIGLGRMASVYLAAGPSFFFNFRSSDDLTINNQDVGKLNYKNAELALNLGAGVKLLKHLQVGVNYNMPFTDSGKAQLRDNIGAGAWDALRGKSFKTKMWQVSVAYIF